MLLRQITSLTADLMVPYDRVAAFVGASMATRLFLEAGVALDSGRSDARMVSSGQSQ